VPSGINVYSPILTARALCPNTLAYAKQTLGFIFSPVDKKARSRRACG
jgi:hypothetical protein